MRFLCLHGRGTNSQIFETQTAAIRYDLGAGNHTYEFIEGTIPTEMVPELRGKASADDSFFAYADFDDLPTCLSALAQLDAYVAEEGPFDGLMAFSQGATISATYLAHCQRQGRPPPFKCAVFFSGSGPFDVDLLEKGELSVLAPGKDDGLPPRPAITIPTAHIWGAQDSSLLPETITAVCAEGKREAYVHEGGHDIPTVRTPAQVKAVVRVIRRVIAMASGSN